jgi:amino acid transporter
MGAVITVLFALLVYINPGSNYHIWFVTYPAHVNALTALVSFGVSGIYLSFLLTVIGAIIARARGWRPEGAFRLGKWAWPVLIVAAGYLGTMFVNVVFPSGLTSARATFNIDWITLFIIFIIAVVGALYLLIGRPDRNVEKHLHDPLEPSGAELPGAAPTS